MFPHSQRLRLRTQKDFFESSKRVWSPTIQWFVVKNEASDSQGAIIVPKAVELKATRRNRLKRQVRAALLPVLLSLPGFSVVGVLKRQKSNSIFDPYEDIRHLNNHLHQTV